MSGGKRDLSADERELWHRVMRSARPLIAREKPEAKQQEIPESQSKSSDTNQLGQVGAKSHPAPQNRKAHRQVPTHAPQPFTIDRRIEQRLRRGTIALDGRLDLHGLTQRRAHSALHHFLVQAQKRGWRNILVITGKGGPMSERGKLPPGLDGSTGTERGVLNRQVPHWLGSGEFQPLVSGFQEAHPRHGGRGALYVRIRRLR